MCVFLSVTVCGLLSVSLSLCLRHVGSIKENRTQPVNKIYGRLPDHSVWYIVASSHYEITHDNYFDDVSLAIAPIITDPDMSSFLRDHPSTEEADLRKKSSVFLYSTFLTGAPNDPGVGKTLKRVLL